MSEYCKLEQKEYKIRHTWVGKLIHRELCKKSKLDYTNEWYMHNIEWSLEDETPKLLEYEELVSAKRRNNVIINRK